MPIQWEKLAGDTSRFAIKIAFSPDPDDGQGIDPDVSVSWGAFQLWAGGKNLCAHHEQGERTEYVYWYLLPLVEWFTCHWYPLLHEEHLPVGDAAGTALGLPSRDPFPATGDRDEGRAGGRVGMRVARLVEPSRDSRRAGRWVVPGCSPAAVRERDRGLLGRQPDPGDAESFRLRRCRSGMRQIPAQEKSRSRCMASCQVQASISNRVRPPPSGSGR